LDIAENLMLGIATPPITSRIQTSSLAFEMAGVLMRNGALRPTPNQPKDTCHWIFPRPVATSQPVLPKNPFKAQQPRPVQASRSLLVNSPGPSQPIQSTQVRSSEQMRAMHYQNSKSKHRLKTSKQKKARVWEKIRPTIG